MSQILEPIELLHTIIDAKANYYQQQGHPPHLLRLPIVLACHIAMLGKNDLGTLAERLVEQGIIVFEREGLLGVPVKLVPGSGEFIFE